MRSRYQSRYQPRTASKYAGRGPSALGEGVGYEPEATALFVRFSAAPTAARKTLINEVFRAGKRDGWMAKLDALYLFAAADEQAAQRNWVSDTYNMAPQFGPTFLADSYYKGDGTASYLESGFNPTTAVAPKFTQDSASMCLGSRTNNPNGAGASSEVGNNNSRIGRSATISGTVVGRPNSASTLTSMIAGAFPGIMGWSRTSAASWRAYVSGLDVGGGTDASTALTNTTFQALKANAVSFGVNEITFVAWGGALTAGEHLSFYRAIANYLWGVGAIAGGPF